MKPATKSDVMIAALFIIVFFYLAAWIFWNPNREAVQRIEQKVERCK